MCVLEIVQTCFYGAHAYLKLLYNVQLIVTQFCLFNVRWSFFSSIYSFIHYAVLILRTTFKLK